MNLKAAFLPGTPADPDDYWLGLGVIALVDAVRLSVMGPGNSAALWFVVLFFVAALHMNRLRDAARPRTLALVVLAAGVIAKGFTAVMAMSIAASFAYLRARGIDPSDAEAFQAMAADPGFQADLDRFLRENAEQLQPLLLEAGAWPSLVAFWAVIGLLGFWYARMGRGRSANDRR
ncbi:hypothetical protein E5163_00740 [Marinicauda algicola]|uniref:DUF4199 domain-containing protein n=1 Tax=Marinicauda algicola TaxID=2029849 RepID=A0A4S2H275_9PROT|nr:hypothetical protein [Marinicauda algicola]TGY89700.1 hypothetical protein E5163_00740 [Marinicauda algicola]